MYKAENIEGRRRGMETEKRRRKNFICCKNWKW